MESRIDLEAFKPEIFSIQDPQLRLLSDLEKLNLFLRAQGPAGEWGSAMSKTNPHETCAPEAAEAAKLADDLVAVMPLMRFRVLSRDGFRCVACGRGAKDGVILHVDHVLPRSKGGDSAIDNLQTLCWECNLGKSNRFSGRI